MEPSNSESVRLGAESHKKNLWKEVESNITHQLCSCTVKGCDAADGS